MIDWSKAAYTQKQWFWSVNLVAVLASLGILSRGVWSAPLSALALFPYVFIAALAIAWTFVAYPLSFAMKKQSSYLRAGSWGLFVSIAIALVGFVFARMLANGQLGYGEAMQMQNGTLTPYGWKLVMHRNFQFLGFGIVIALITRLIIGPGRTVSDAP